MLLSLAAALSVSMHKVVFVATAPSFENYMHTYQLEERVLPDLQSTHGANTTFALLNPPCTECDTLSGKTEKQGVEALLSLMWTETDIANQLQAELADLSAFESAVVFGVDVSFSSNVTAAYENVSFVELNVNSNAGGKTIKAANHVALNIETLKAAYVDGVVAGMTSKLGKQKVAMLSSDNPSSMNKDFTRVNQAFRQGIADATGSVCSYEVLVTLPSFSTWDETAYDSVRDTALKTFTVDGADVLYTQLGAYDTAVLSATFAANQTATSPLFSVTGAWSGANINRETLGSAWLSRNSVNWQSVVSEVLNTFNSQGITGVSAPRDSSESQWTADFSERVWPPSVVEQRQSNCSEVDFHFDVIDSVADSVKNTAIPISDEPATGTCSTLAVQLQPTRDLMNACLSTQQAIRLVGVGIYINTLGNVDMKTGSFFIDYNLYLRQSKTRYTSLEDARAVNSDGSVCNNGPCVCPRMGENEWENYVPSDVTADRFWEVVNIVNIDRLKMVSPIIKLDTVGTADELFDHFRIQASHYFSPKLNEWPIDTQRLHVLLEDMAESTSDDPSITFCHLDAFSGLSTSARYFPGMTLKIGDKPWTVDTTDACWPYSRYPDAYVDGVCNDDGINPNPVRYDKEALPLGDVSCSCLGGTKASSRYAFNIVFERPVLPSFMKTFLPAIFITVVNQGVWFLHPKVYETRLGVCGSSLISGVMYHVSLASNTPETSVMTWADRFMVVVYYNNLVAFILVFYQTVLYQAEMERLSWTAFRLTRMWGPMVAILTFIGVIAFDDLNDVLAWITISTAAAGVFVYFIADPLLYWAAPKFLAYLDQVNQNVKDAEHIEAVPMNAY
ncbi:hypothetical protein DIPPA_25409 [Diplonema papillatum]|nr:hypothetical protein DIPPA_25409 [Diplonema papillatum]